MSSHEQSSTASGVRTPPPLMGDASGHPDPRAGSSAIAALESGESAERGRAARKDVPRSAHGDWAPAPDRPDPVAVLTARPPRACRSSSRSATGECSSRRSPSTAARRPSWRPTSQSRRIQRHRRAGVRRRPHLELRRIRGSRPQTPLQPERLRRDAARPVGVGRQADGGQRRDRRPRHRASRAERRATDRDRLRARVPRGDARLRGRKPPGCLVSSA